MKTNYHEFAGVELTLREMKIISHLVQLHTRKVIADNLGISVNTLGHQLTILYLKTETGNFLQLILKARENGFDKQGNYNGKPLE